MFQNYLIRIKVELNSDLTHYLSKLTQGLIGYTIGNAYKSDTYTAVIDVSFENGVTAPITLDKLTIIDEEYLTFLEKRERKFLDSLANATNIIKKVGPKGGFKKLTFKYDFGEMDIYNRSQAEKIINEFEKLKKEIKEVII